jgi:hypothetical protein
MTKFLIRDRDPESGINISDPQHWYAVVVNNYCLLCFLLFSILFSQTKKVEIQIVEEFEKDEGLLQQSRLAGRSYKKAFKVLYTIQILYCAYR